jgi:hypothetical protein
MLKEDGDKRRGSRSGTAGRWSSSEARAFSSATSKFQLLTPCTYASCVRKGLRQWRPPSLRLEAKASGLNLHPSRGESSIMGAGLQGLAFRALRLRVQ